MKKIIIIFLSYLSVTFNTFSALSVISSKLPIGVETIYKPGRKSFIKYENSF